MGDGGDCNVDVMGGYCRFVVRVFTIVMECGPGDAGKTFCG